MTKFKETAVDVTSDASIPYDSRAWSNPYSYQVPIGIIGRSYNILSFDWTAASGITSIPLMGQLSQFTGIAAVLKLFRYCRASFKLHFKMTSSQYHQGSAMIGWMPCVVWSAIPKDKQALSCYNTLILSASKQESGTLVIPYMSPEDWMDTTIITSTSYEHATAFFAPLNTLLTTNPSVPAVVPIEVFGSIETLDLSGAISQMKIFKGSNRRGNMSRATQVIPYKKDRIEYLTRRFYRKWGQHYIFISYFEIMCEHIRAHTHNKRTDFSAWITSEQHDQQVTVDIEFEDLSDVRKQMSSKKDEEARKKEQQGKDAAVGSVIRNTSQLVRRVPVIGDIWSPIADTINFIFGTELSKPVTTATSKNVHQRYYSDHNQADGVSDATYMSLYQNPRIKVAPMMYGMDTSFKSFRKFAGTPMLYDQIIFDGTTNTWTCPVKMEAVGATLTKPDYLCMTQKMFRFVRGSIKYMIHFCLPCFYAVRMRIRVQNAASVVDPANVPNMIIDVKGDVWQGITVPLLNPRPWIDRVYSSVNLTSNLIIDMLTPIVGPPSPTVAVVYCNIFRAGGEDTQWAVPWDPTIAPTAQCKTSCEVADLSGVKKQMACIQKMFEKTFEPIATTQSFCEEKNSIMSEDIGALADLLKRPHRYATGIPTIGAFGQTAAVTAHRIIADSFMWIRGSYVARHMHRFNTSTKQDGFYMRVGSTSTYQPEYGWAPMYSGVGMPVLGQQEAVAMPYYCATPYIVTFRAATYVHGTSQRVLPVVLDYNVATIDTLTIAAGDDMTLLFQVPWAQSNFPSPDEIPKTTHKLRIVANDTPSGFAILTTSDQN